RRAHKEQAKIGGILIHKTRRANLGMLETGIGLAFAALAYIDTFEVAVLVARWNAGLLQQQVGALQVLAVARRYAAYAIHLNRLPSRAVTLWAILLGHGDGVILIQAGVGGGENWSGHGVRNPGLGKPHSRPNYSSLSPKGAGYHSPGQRPGSKVHTPFNL